MLNQQIKDDMVSALKSGDTLKVSVLRMLLSEINYKQIDLQRELKDEDIVGVIAKEVKKRNEAVASFKAGGRNEQAESEAKEGEILKVYLPEMMSEDDIKKQLAEIAEIQGIKEFGQVMRVVSPVFKGKADGSTVAKIVKEWLQQ